MGHNGICLARLARLRALNVPELPLDPIAMPSSERKWASVLGVVMILALHRRNLPDLEAPAVPDRDGLARQGSVGISEACPKPEFDSRAFKRISVLSEMGPSS